MRSTHAIRTVAALLIAGLLASCSGTQRPPTREELDDAEKPDEWREREAQSDFLDIGKQAGIQWLSFVQNDQREYPEYFEGFDRDQKRRLRLAPKEDATNRVLLEFNLPKGSKLWPVDWYGTELMAIDLPGTKNISLALTRADKPKGAVVGEIARRFMDNNSGKALDNGSGGPWDKKLDMGEVVFRDDIAIVMSPVEGHAHVAYGERTVAGREAEYRIVVEVLEAGDPSRLRTAAKQVLDSISIKRELALEGSPKHKCSSSMDELLRGTLHFPGGTLNLPLTDGYLARKIGGDSTVQIDGEGASPWLLLRRLDAAGEQGLKQRIRADTTFKRRRDVPSARFEAGRIHKAALSIVSFDYRDSTAEQQALGVIAFGTELFTFEIISRGVTDGDARRGAREKAIALLEGATGTAAEQDLQPLEGWMPSE